MNDPSYFCILFTTGNSFSETVSLCSVIGATNLTVNRNKSFSQPYFVGGYSNNFNINSAENIQISFDKVLYTLDDHIYLTGENPITRMYIYDTSKYYEFCNLYLNNFKAQFSAGSVPIINLTLNSYGECYKVIDFIPYNYVEMKPTPLEIPNVKNIFISGATDNVICNKNINAFDYNLSIDRQPYFSVGRLSAVEVTRSTPIQISSAVFAKSTSLIERTQELINLEKIQKFTDFSIVACNTNFDIWKYKVSCAALISNEIKISNINTIDIQENYLGYI